MPRSSGRAWLDERLRHHLAPEFQVSFCEAVPAHRALLGESAMPGD